MSFLVHSPALYVYLANHLFRQKQWRRSDPNYADFRGGPRRSLCRALSFSLTKHGDPRANYPVRTVRPDPVVQESDLTPTPLPRPRTGTGPTTERDTLFGSDRILGVLERNLRHYLTVPVRVRDYGVDPTP